MTADDGQGTPAADLAACRAAIAVIDAQLIAMLAERIALSRRTTALKRAAGLPLLDPQREAEVIRRVGEAARQHRLPSEAIRDIWWQVIGLSRRAQEDAP